MPLVLDTGAILALYDSADDSHLAVRQAFERELGPCFLPSPTLAEVDYLLRASLGIDAEIKFLDDLLAGNFVLIDLISADLIRCRDLVQQYRDLDIGIADASVVAIAERLVVGRILTVDKRHFRIIRPLSGRPFTLLPWDDQ